MTPEEIKRRLMEMPIDDELPDRLSCLARTVLRQMRPRHLVLEIREPGRGPGGNRRHYIDACLCYPEVGDPPRKLVYDRVMYAMGTWYRHMSPYLVVDADGKMSPIHDIYISITR